MGKKIKTGKARRDKFYHLAKETGFRARSAFKLIQLNRKYEFLQKARVCIDLCAAPGGWMQVAARNMPPSSLIVGVDLVPIKPIKGCIGLQADITTEKCRQMLRKELKTWKADVVLHDGAPNVGKAWVQDAYTQSALVLKSLKLATEFLVPNGCFVTKVFRSQDYQALMWVFNQLFRKVRSTKPSSSRNVSAEIFVVCQGYLAPHKIDPKMLDPSHVFEEIQMDKAPVDLFSDKKPKKRQAEGYADGKTLLFDVCSAEEFCQRDDFLEVLAEYSEIRFDSDSPLLTHSATTEEIKLLCKDLRVLGKKDFKALVRWRSQMRSFLEQRAEQSLQEAEDVNMSEGSDNDGNEDSAGDDDEESMEEDSADEGGAADSDSGGSSDEDSDENDDADNEIDQAIREAKAMAKARQKRDKRRKQKERAKLREKISLQMETPKDVAETAADEMLFDLKKIKTKSQLDRVDDGEWDTVDVSGVQADTEFLTALDRSNKGRRDTRDGNADEADEVESDDSDEDYQALLEQQLDQQYEEYRARKGSKFKRVKFHNKSTTFRADLAGIEADAGDDEDAVVAKALASVEQKLKRTVGPTPDNDDDDNDGDDALSSNADEDDDDEDESVLVRNRKQSVTAEKKAALWFSRKEFADLGLDADVTDEEEEDEEQVKQHVTDDDVKRSSIERAADKDATQLSSAKKRKAEDVTWAASLGLVEHDIDQVDSEEEDDVIDAAGQGSDDDNDAGDERGFEVVSQDTKVKSSGINLDAKGLALAAEMIVRKKKRELLDSGYNRFAYNDDPLPNWFDDEEHIHRQPSVPISKEMVKEIKERERALNARPIKKILEAKGRKKRKASRQMEKINQQVEAITNNDTLTEQEKVSQIRQLYKKVNRKKKEETTYVVAKKATASKRPVRPRGLKGRYLMVDKRMKSDKRGLERAEKRSAKRRKRH